MTVTLPGIIKEYVDASNKHDVQAILSCFSDDALVHDERETLQGKKAIEGWIEFRQLIVEGQATGEVAAGDADQLVIAITASLAGLVRFGVHHPEQFPRL